MPVRMARRTHKGVGGGRGVRLPTRRPTAVGTAAESDPEGPHNYGERWRRRCPFTTLWSPFPLRALANVFQRLGHMGSPKPKHALEDKMR